MESRPLRNILNLVINSLDSILRWPLDHLVPSCSNETVLQVCVTLNLVSAISLLLGGFRTKGNKVRITIVAAGTDANYLFLSILNILTRFPKRSDLLSIARSYLLLLSTFLKLLMFIGQFSSKEHRDDPFLGIIHFYFIIDIFILPGLWQAFDKGDAIICIFLWFSIIAWIIIGFIIFGKEGSKIEGESKGTNLSIDEEKHNARQILVVSIDTIIVLLLQYA